MFLAGREAWRQFRSGRNALGRALAFGIFGAILSVLVHGFVDFLFRVSAPFGTLFWLLLALLVANASVGVAPGPCPRSLSNPVLRSRVAGMGSVARTASVKGGL